MAEPLIIECTDQLNGILEYLLSTGLFGPTRETVAQRMLELKAWEFLQTFIKKTSDK